MSVQNIELIRSQSNRIHWLIPEQNMNEIRLLLATEDNIVVKLQTSFIEEGGGTGVYADFPSAEIENIFNQKGATSTYLLKDTQYDEILFTGSVTLTGEGGGTPAEVVFTDLVAKKTTAAIGDVPVEAAVDLVQTSDKKVYRKNEAGNAFEEVGSGGAKIYRALLSHQGGDYPDPPTAVVLENTIGNIVWGRASGGQYTATLAAAFPQNKVWLTPSLSNGNAMGVPMADFATYLEFKRVSDDVLQFCFSDPFDHFIQFMPILIMVYP